MAQITLNPEYDAGVSHRATTNLVTWTWVVDNIGTHRLTYDGYVVNDYISFSGRYTCQRVYARWDTTPIPPSAILTSANIQYYLDNDRGNNTEYQNFKLDKSDNLTSQDITLYESITDTLSTTGYDIGPSGTGLNQYHTFPIDGPLLDYFQLQINLGLKCATLLRGGLDWNNALTSDPTIVYYRSFLPVIDRFGNPTTYPPVLTINYTTGPPPHKTFVLKSGKINVKGGKLIIK